MKQLSITKTPRTQRNLTKVIEGLQEAGYDLRGFLKQNYEVIKGTQADACWVYSRGFRKGNRPDCPRFATLTIAGNQFDPLRLAFWARDGRYPSKGARFVNVCGEPECIKPDHWKQTGGAIVAPRRLESEAKPAPEAPAVQDPPPRLRPLSERIQDPPPHLRPLSERDAHMIRFLAYVAEWDDGRIRGLFRIEQPTLEDVLSGRLFPITPEPELPVDVKPWRV